jgi:hypothetical protein
MSHYTNRTQILMAVRGCKSCKTIETLLAYAIDASIPLVLNLRIAHSLYDTKRVPVPPGRWRKKNAIGKPEIHE